MTGVGRGREEWRPGQAQVTGGLGRTVLDVENPLRGHRQNSPKPSHGPPRHPTRRYQPRTPDPLSRDPGQPTRPGARPGCCIRNTRLSPCTDTSSRNSRHWGAGERNACDVCILRD